MVALAKILGKWFGRKHQQDVGFLEIVQKGRVGVPYPFLEEQRTILRALLFLRSLRDLVKHVVVPKDMKRLLSSLFQG